MGRKNDVAPALRAWRKRQKLSQTQAALKLKISARTLQEWEQGRRHPSGAARSLLTIAARRPEVLREVFE